MIPSRLFKIERNKYEQISDQSINDGHIQLAIFITLVSALCIIIPPLKLHLSTDSGHFLRMLGATIVTSFLIHEDFSHLFSNMIFYFLYAPPVEERIGRENFILLFFACGFGSRIINYNLTLHLNPYSSLGSSGAIFGIMTYASILFFERKIVLFNTFKIPFWLLTAFYVTGEFFNAKHLYLHGPNGEGNQTGHISHVAGALVGFGYYLIFGDKKVIKKLPTEEWSSSDYIDMGLAIFSPFVVALVKNMPSHSKLIITGAYFWNYKLAVLAAVYFTYECISSEKEERKKYLKQGEI